MSEITTDNPQLLGAHGHYENFPVASLLVPAALRPAIATVYRFARYADDVADEGSAPAPERVAELTRMDQALLGHGSHRLVDPLMPIINRYHLPVRHFRDLLSAFIQDAEGAPLPTRDSVLDYCQRSANPVGRIVLHLFRVNHNSALDSADQICSALQLINFAQDLGQDTERGRCYIPADEMQSFNVTWEDLEQCVARRAISDPVRRLLDLQLDKAAAMLGAGPALLSHVPLRLKLELAGVMSGGYQTLRRVRREDPFALRIKLGRRDAPAILFSAARVLLTRRLS